MTASTCVITHFKASDFVSMTPAYGGGMKNLVFWPPSEKGTWTFRPISLLNGVYKIIAKALASCLSTIMESIILEFQSSVRGRQIQDSTVVADELIDCRMKEKLPSVLYKLDFFKRLTIFLGTTWNICW